jgi:hypothetical protein
MRSPEEQMEGLIRLAELVGNSECNTTIMPAGSDVAYLMAAHTPRASQIVYASGGYDVWVYDPKGSDDTFSSGYHLQCPDLSIEDVAKVVVGEYHQAKAARIKALHPNWSVDFIMKKLAKGYQKSIKQQRKNLERLVAYATSPTPGHCNFGAMVFFNLPGDVAFLAPIAPELRGVEIVSPSAPRDDGRDFSIRRRGQPIKMIKHDLTAAEVVTWLNQQCQHTEADYLRNGEAWATSVMQFYGVPERG